MFLVYQLCGGTYKILIATFEKRIDAEERCLAEAQADYYERYLYESQKFQGIYWKGKNDLLTMGNYYVEELEGEQNGMVCSQKLSRTET